MKQRDRSETVLAYIASHGPIEARDIAAGLAMELRPVRCALSRLLNKWKRIRIASERRIDDDSGSTYTIYAYAAVDGIAVAAPLIESAPIRVPIATYDALSALRAMQEAAHRHQQFQRT